MKELITCLTRTHLYSVQNKKRQALWLPAYRTCLFPVWGLVKLCCALLVFREQEMFAVEHSVSKLRNPVAEYQHTLVV